MHRFKVLEGKHTELPPKKTGDEKIDQARVLQTRVYKKGEIFESEKELDKIFQNKFQRISSGDSEALSMGHPNTREIADDPDSNYDIMDEQAQELKSHKGLDPDAPRAKRLQGRAAAMAAEDEDEDDEPVESDLGEDVTTDFPEAKKAEMKVFRDGKKFNISEASDPETAINKKPMTKTEATKFLKEQVSDEEE